MRRGRKRLRLRARAAGPQGGTPPSVPARSARPSPPLPPTTSPSVVKSHEVGPTREPGGLLAQPQHPQLPRRPSAVLGTSLAFTHHPNTPPPIPQCGSSTPTASEPGSSILPTPSNSPSYPFGSTRAPRGRLPRLDSSRLACREELQPRKPRPSSSWTPPAP